MFSLIVLAAGSGSRMKLGYNKMFYKIDNEYLINKTLTPFLSNERINEIIVVVNKNEVSQIKDIINNDKIKIIVGGNERYNSVYNGLLNVSNDYVLIHDGARCFITDILINKIIDATIEYDAAFLGVKSKDTVHKVNNKGFITSLLERESLVNAQTPQGFNTKLVLNSYITMFDSADIVGVTDDVMVVKKYGGVASKFVESDYSNIKVTTMDDVL